MCALNSSVLFVFAARRSLPSMSWSNGDWSSFQPISLDLVFALHLCLHFETRKPIFRNLFVQVSVFPDSLSNQHAFGRSTCCFASWEDYFVPVALWDWRPCSSGDYNLLLKFHFHSSSLLSTFETRYSECWCSKSLCSISCNGSRQSLTFRSTGRLVL